MKANHGSSGTAGLHRLVNAEAKWALSTQWKMIQSQKGSSETHCNWDKPESIVLNEVSQSQKGKCSLSPMWEAPRVVISIPCGHIHIHARVE